MSSLGVRFYGFGGVVCGFSVLLSLRNSVRTAVLLHCAFVGVARGCGSL